MTGIDLACEASTTSWSRQRLIGLAQRNQDRATFFLRAAIVSLRRMSMT
jgi:hypothetical protein